MSGMLGELVGRLAAVGIVAPRAEAVVVDLAGDPPLGQSRRAIAVEEAARVVEGTAAAMLAAGATRGVVAVRAGDAEAERAIERVATGAVSVGRVAAVWPTVGIDRDLGVAGAWILDGEALLDLEAAALRRTRARRRVTVVGQVRQPGVIAHDAPLSVEELVAQAGGASCDAWVVLDGGGLGGRIVDRDVAPSSSLLLVLPASHALVARARTSVSDWLRRAASACEGCRACSDACPVLLDGGALAPHEVIATLVSGRDDGVRLQSATACVGCAVCDAVCPQTLSPWQMVEAVRSRLPGHAPAPLHQRRQSAAHVDRDTRRLSIDLLASRLGLG